MSDDSLISASQPLSFRYAAVQRVLGVVDVVMLRDSEGRSTPAKVYPASEGAQEWVVEAPVSDEPHSGECRTFTGPVALLMALEYAHCTYGSAVYLSR